MSLIYQIAKSIHFFSLNNPWLCFQLGNKAKERRSRQSDIMSDLKNLDVMLGSYQRDDCEAQNGNDDGEIDLRSTRHEENANQNENDYRSYLNTNLSENSCLTVETSRASSSKISSQMSKKFEEMQSSLNSQILDVINTAIDTRVLPSIKNAVKGQNAAKIQVWTFGQTDCIKIMQPKKILRRTFGQIDCIQKMLINRPGMLRMNFRG